MSKMNLLTFINKKLRNFENLVAIFDWQMRNQARKQFKSRSASQWKKVV